MHFFLRYKEAKSKLQCTEAAKRKTLDELYSRLNQSAQENFALIEERNLQNERTKTDAETVKNLKDELEDTKKSYLHLKKFCEEER